VAPGVIDTEAGLLGVVPVLEGAWVAGVDLRATPLDWAALTVAGATFAGCRLPDGIGSSLVARGAAVLSPIDGLPFDPYRSSLYGNADLMEGYEAGRPETTLDARIGAAAVLEPSPREALARGMHDAGIDAALTRFLECAPGHVVGVMGSHIAGRDSREYRDAARLGRALAREGFVVATGGGPGLMEAANLGAWLADADDAALDDALGVLVAAPMYADDPPAFLECALTVRSRWPDGRTTLGVPTWVYVDEPLNQFSTHIAKYFHNSVRENGLLAIALGGVVYTPGGSGTAQEIFTDAAQNDYTMYDVRSPMVLLGADHYERERSGLLSALRSLAEEGGWADLVRVVDDVDDAVVVIRDLAPPGPTPPCAPLRRR
jgi:predicted Rossmann-fold nucleotide-binding protein